MLKSTQWVKSFNNILYLKQHYVSILPFAVNSASQSYDSQCVIINKWRTEFFVSVHCYILQYCYRNMEFVLMSMVFPIHDKEENYYIFSQWKTLYYLLIISWFYVVCLLFSSQDISNLKYITSLYHKPKASEYLA